VVSKAYLEEMGASPPLNLKDEGARELFGRIVLARGYEVVFLDNIFSLFPGLDLKSDTDWGPVNEWLLRLRAKGLTLILLHHPPKKQEYQFGTGSMIWNADTVLFLKNAKEYSDNCSFTIQVQKSRVRGLGLEGKRFELTDEGWVVHGMNPQELQMATAIDLWLKKKSQVKIGEHLKMGQSAVSKILQKARDRGLIDDDGITSEGQQFLESHGVDISENE
jgi:putative DNA primase/helicase